MPAKSALIALAAAAIMASVSAAEAGMGNINLVTPRIAFLPTIPTPPNVKAQLIDARLKPMHCYYTRERNELGVWERRTHCHYIGCGSNCAKQCRGNV